MWTPDGWYIGGMLTLPQTNDTTPQLFYEPRDLGYFYCTVDLMKDALYHLNRNFQLRGWIILSEFYEFLGLGKTDYGDLHGYSTYKMGEDGIAPWIDIIYEKHPGFYTMTYYFEPQHIYEWEE